MAIEAALFGTLGTDAEQKISKTEKPYLRMNVRTGEGDAAVWVSVMAFDRDAIDLADKFIRGARVYVEGKLTPTTWLGENGIMRHGLSIMSWHCRLAQIGRNEPVRKPKPHREDRGRSLKTAAAAAPFNDEIGF